MLILQTAWKFTKKYWQTILLVVACTCAYNMIQKSREGVAETLHKMQEAHEEELAKVNSIREEERRQHEANLAQLQASLEAEKKVYEEKKQVFEEKRNTEIVNLVKQYGDDPSALAQKLSDVTGFQIIIAEGK
jgi:flagellar motility protein MotE (MotC chaperone)